MMIEAYRRLWPRFCQALWDENWRRVLPPESEVRELFAGWDSPDPYLYSVMHDACMFRSRIREFGVEPIPPDELQCIFFVPTIEFVDALAEEIRALGARRVVEVCAGEGLLGFSLQERLPEVEVLVTDGKRTHFDFWPEEVLEYEANEALEKLRPDISICAWAPYRGFDLDLARSPNLQVHFEIGERAGGCTNHSEFWDRYAHEHDERLSSLGACRTDRSHHSVYRFYGPAHTKWTSRRSLREEMGIR